MSSKDPRNGRYRVRLNCRGYYWLDVYRGGLWCPVEPFVFRWTAVLAAKLRVRFQPPAKAEEQIVWEQP